MPWPGRCHLDFGAAAGAYVEAFMAHIDWASMLKRYQQAVKHGSKPFAVDDAPSAVLLDVRRATAFDQADAMIEGARWRDPVSVDRWASEVSTAGRVVVYCAHGHEVSQATALRLRAAGIDAHFLKGGFEGWKAAGRPVVPKG
ncbi:MAG: rhodanese-like domain-containing protein [Pseudomonadota bacterium]